MKFQIKNGSVTINGNTILECINFEINDKEKVGIVGRNGAGKTTLLKAIIDNELLDEGTGEDKFAINKIGKFNIGFMRQIEFDNESNTLLEEIKVPFKNLIKMEEDINNYVDIMNKNNSIEIIKKYTDLQEQFKLLGGYSYKKEYEIMLHKFGFTESDKEKMISSFSGGERTKIAFMKLLLSHPDLLILDEPTNHLDIKTIEWLEEYLSNYSGAIILVSHDRMFLNNIVNIIYDIEYGETVKYVGNYEKYEKNKKIRYDKMLKDYEFQQKEIARLKAIYERFRSKPSKSSMALSKLHQLERMDILEKTNEIDNKTFKTNLSEMEESVKNVMIAENLVIGYDKPIATLNMTIKRGKKIGVIGKNGSGKSTLLKTLNGLITPIDGTISYGLHVNPGYFDQSLAFESLTRTILADYMEYLPDITENQARSALGSFLFKGDDVFKTIECLSGGEKVRLQLCKILYKKPNLLILDEPTNHMDIVGKEHLEDILSDYKGTIIFVSHDRYFVNKIADELIVFDESGLTYYPYTYEEYMLRLKNSEEKVIEKAKKEKAKKEEKTEQKVNIYDLKKDLNKLENEIIRLESEINKLNEELFKENVYSDFNKSTSINKKIEDKKEELVILNNKWEELTNMIISNQ